MKDYWKFPAGSLDTVSFDFASFYWFLPFNASANFLGPEKLKKFTQIQKNVKNELF